MSQAERQASPDRRYHIRRSAPVGRIVVRATKRAAGASRRKKPKSWHTRFWFKSQLFARGTTSRRARFAALLDAIRRPA